MLEVETTVYDGEKFQSRLFGKVCVGQLEKYIPSFNKVHFSMS